MSSVRAGVSGILKIHGLHTRLSKLVKTPVFWAFTIWGNVCILGGAELMHRLEGEINPAAADYVDCLIWAVGIVTTVGSGGIVPVTLAGKVLLIVMMMGGALFLWSYMAIFIGALVEPELHSLEKEVSELQHEVREEEELLGKLREILAKNRMRAEKNNPNRN